MRCDWGALINLLPLWLRADVDKHNNQPIQELRLRLNKQPCLVTANRNIYLSGSICEEDLRFCINAASRYSPWTAETISSGYITAPGGHRVGICGQAVIHNENMCGINRPTSLCIRVARDFLGIASGVAQCNDSTLIIGRPGSGKTTLLRDLIRQRAKLCEGSVAVVDERQEIFPHSQGSICFYTGENVDVLSGCSKAQGINAVLRSMSPAVIALDEITAQEDCLALLHAGWCGVKLLATAHAGSREDLLKRPVYRPLMEAKLFDRILMLDADKTFREERFDYKCTSC